MIELYSNGNVLEFENIDDARFYFWNHLTRGERKSVALENKYNQDFPEISAEYELIVDGVGIKFDSYAEALEYYESLTKEKRLEVDEDTSRKGAFYEKLAKQTS